MKKVNLQLIVIFVFLFTASMGFARDYIIYSIVQDFPMGEPGETISKNFYVDLGATQGVREGTLLDVYRNISRHDPYKRNKQQFNYNVKIGELKVIHAEDNAAIAELNTIRIGKSSPLFEINNFMIGDKINVHVNN